MSGLIAARIGTKRLETHTHHSAHSAQNTSHNECMKIVRSTVSEIFDSPLFDELAGEYRNFSGHASLTGAPDRKTYEELESVGYLKASAAYNGERLIGFVAVVITPSLHNSKLIAIVDTLFLTEAARTGYNGVKLIGEARALAKEFRAAGIRYSAPVGSRLEKLFALFFEQTDVSFYESLEK